MWWSTDIGRICFLKCIELVQSYAVCRRVVKVHSNSFTCQADFQASVPNHKGDVAAFHGKVNRMWCGKKCILVLCQKWLHISLWNFPVLKSLLNDFSAQIVRVCLSCKKLKIQCDDGRNRTTLALGLFPSPSCRSSVSQTHAFWQTLPLLLPCSFCLHSNLVFLLRLPSCFHHLTSISCFLYCCNHCVFSHSDPFVTVGAAQLFASRLACMHSLSHFHLVFSPSW